MREIDDRAVWSAAGVLCATVRLPVKLGVAAIRQRAVEMDVPAADVAAFVEYRGYLPD